MKRLVVIAVFFLASMVLADQNKYIEPRGSDHVPQHWTYPDNTTMVNDTGFFSQDLFKIAYEQDNGEFWQLTQVSPQVWTWQGGAPYIANGWTLNQNAGSIWSITNSNSLSGSYIRFAIVGASSANFTVWSLTYPVLVPDVAGGLTILNSGGPIVLNSYGPLRLYDTQAGGRYTTNGLVATSSGNGSLVVTQLGGQTVVTSTVDQTAIGETAHVVYTVPANTAAVGTTYRITAWGDMDNGTTAITFTPRIRWGGVGGVLLLGVPTVVSTTTALTNKAWRAKALVTIRSIGATGTAMAQLALSNHTASAIGSYLADEADIAAPVTIDTTAAKDLDLTWTMSSITGTPHVRTYGGFVEIVKP